MAKPLEPDRRLKLLATLLLGVGTALSAWSAFQGAKLRGRQTQASAQSTRLLVDSARASGRRTASAME